MIDAGRLREAMAGTRERIDDAARRSGRDPQDVEIVLAGKYIPPEESELLAAAGIAVIGENRLQDLEAKHASLGDRVTFDFIGHLQRRKVRRVLPLVRLVHSVDSVSLAREISERADGTVRILIQVNTSGEPTKGGVAPSGLARFMDEIDELPNLVVGGFMTLPPKCESAEDARPFFASLRELQGQFAGGWSDRHDFRDLSMGTSQDFLVAVEEGATRVRIGRAMIELAQVS